jgi:two-component system LytT family sensor kinase
MQNPFLKNRKVFFTYWLIWLILGLLSFMVMSLLINTNKLFLGVDIFIQNVLFAMMLIGFWYPIKFMNIETMKLPTLIFNHTLTYLTFTFLWVSATIFLLKLIFKGIEETQYLQNSLPYKFFFSFFGYPVFVISIYFMRYYNSFKEKKDIENKLNNAIKEAELTLLRNQMNPHFIFNSLNSISSLTIIDPEKAHDMVIKLSDFLRYTVGYGQLQKVSLKKEMEMCQAYLDIEKIRFGDKINVEITIEKPALEIEVPSMLLQTLFENAIKHGIYNSLNAENISFSAKIEENRLLMVLINSFDHFDKPKKGTQTGLKNIKERLRLIYGQYAIFKTETVENKFSVTINLPLTS